MAARGELAPSPESALRMSMALSASLLASCQPIRGQYSGHVICDDQSEASIHLKLLGLDESVGSGDQGVCVEGLRLKSINQ